MVTDIPTSQELFWAWLREGWKYRSIKNPYINENRSFYSERVKYEAGLIVQKDYVDLFLLTSDAVRWAKDRGIAVGPGRGSVVASLVAWLLRISEVNPMKFPSMMFERFIDVTRDDMPDIDLDFDDERRDELYRYLVSKYGSDCVGNVGTYTRFRGRNTLKDVARVYNIPEYTIKPVKDLLIARPDGEEQYTTSIIDTLNAFPELNEQFQMFPQLRHAIDLEGNLRSAGMHPAGVVISSSPLTDSVATYERGVGTGSKKKIRQVCSVDKYDSEHLGFIKADFLGLTTMGMVGQALELIGDVTLEDLYNLSLDDEKVMQSFRNGDVVGIFQFTGGATRIVNKEVQPNRFMELADISTLSRPGPLYSGSTQDYIDVKFGNKKLESIQDHYDDIVKETYGQIIYQEQIMRIVRDLGGFDWKQTTAIRKIIQRKMGEASFAKWLALFISGCESNGISEKQARAIWSRIVTAGSYVFNVPHSVSYAVVAYWTMWLKRYHPLAFYTACLRKYSSEDYQFVLMRDALNHSIDVEPPNIAESGMTWEAVTRQTSGQPGVPRSALRAGLESLPGVGEALARTIVADRSERLTPLEKPEDLLSVKGFGQAKLSKIMDFVYNDDPFKIYRVDKILKEIREEIDNGEIPLPVPTHRADEISANAGEIPITFLGIPTSRDIYNILEDERTATGDSLEIIKDRIEQPELSERAVIKIIDDTDQMVFGRINRFRFPKFKSAFESLILDKDAILIQGIKSPGLSLGIRIKDLWVIETDS